MSELTFAGLGLPDTLLSTITRLGYEKPSPIQAQAIPALLEGRDLIGQAQTGTGKTAAFALPILATINPNQAQPQALILAPTRELAMQVADALTTYSENVGNARVLAVYGGQSMRDQLQALRQGVQIVVGTPGRLLDHLERKSLDLSALKWVVLDEADEMLRMGFIDDVEAILGHTGGVQQTALFSATMPPRIKQIAERYLKDPQQIVIPAATRTNASIEQRVLAVRQRDKAAAVVRLLASEDCDATIIFTRTRESTVELADFLSGFGHAATAINGDMNQAQREQTIALLKAGKIDVLVATDVAARGLDVERISHVINFDLPMEADTYVHRIGRTGRAGRSGKAILLADPRDRSKISFIERATRQPLLPMELPTDEELRALAEQRFRLKLADHLHSGDSSRWQPLLDSLCQEMDLGAEVIAAGLIGLLAQQQGIARKLPSVGEVSAERAPRKPRGEGATFSGTMQSYRIAVGRAHRAQVGDIVGAIANEAGLNSGQIGRIQLYETFSTVDLPNDLPSNIIQQLKAVRVRNQALEIEPFDEGDAMVREMRPPRRAPRDRDDARPGSRQERPRGDRPDQRPPRFEQRAARYDDADNRGNRIGSHEPRYGNRTDSGPETRPDNRYAPRTDKPGARRGDARPSDARGDFRKPEGRSFDQPYARKPRVERTSRGDGGSSPRDGGDKGAPRHRIALKR
jgi:ATP-dependent RNA helicase DeaD